MAKKPVCFSLREDIVDWLKITAQDRNTTKTRIAEEVFDKYFKMEEKKNEYTNSIPN